MKHKLLISVLIVLATLTTVGCGVMYWLLRITDKMASGQITVVHVLENELQMSGQDLSKASFKARLAVLYPGQRIVETRDTLEVCGARFLFKDGKYDGSQLLP